jgi:hypothetical protein
MFRSRTAWLNSRPGARWREYGRLFLESFDLFTTWTLRKFNYGGGYFVAAFSGTDGGSPPGPAIKVVWSQDLINFDSIVLINDGWPPVVDIICDGSYIYYAAATHPTNFTATKIVRIPLPSGSPERVTIPYALNSLQFKSTSIPFYTRNSGFGFFPFWPTYSDVNLAPAVPRLQCILQIPGTTWGVSIDGPLSSLNYQVFAFKTFSQIGDALGGWSESSGARTNIRLTRPVYTRIQRTPAVEILWAYMYDEAGTTRLTLRGGKFSSFDPATGSFDQVALGTTLNFGVISSAIPVGLVSSDSTGELYLAFDNGEIWKTSNFGTTWTVLTELKELNVNLIAFVPSSYNSTACSTRSGTFISP